MKINEICEIMYSKECRKECSSELFNLLQLCNSVALSYATTERTFSAIHRKKSWLRPNMTVNGLSNKIFANLHKQRVENINSEDVATGCFLIHSFS